MLRLLSSCALLSAAASLLPAQTTTLTSDEVLRIHFSIASAPAPQPDVLQFGIGIVTVNAPFTSRTARLWDCDELLGTAVSTSFGNNSGQLSLAVANSWRETGSLWNFDQPGDVPNFTALQNASIRGIIDFELGTGSITLDLSNVTMQLVRATSANGGSVCSPAPAINEVVVVPKLTGPAPGTAGTTNTWTTTGSAPGALMVYVLGFDCAPIPFPSSPPVFFDLTGPLALFVAIADAGGASTLSLPVPASATGVTLLAQSAELVNFPSTIRVTNFTTVTFP